MSNDLLTNNAGAPVVDNENALTAGPRGPMLLQDTWFLEKLAHFDREVIPERRMHAKGSGAYGTSSAQPGTGGSSVQVSSGGSGSSSQLSAGARSSCQPSTGAVSSCQPSGGACSAPQ